MADDNSKAEGDIDGIPRDSHAKEAADRLNDYVGSRVLPRPPRYAGDDPVEFVAPHWNRTVSLLNGGEGYLAVVEMEKRQQERWLALQEEIEPLEWLLNTLLDIRSAILLEKGPESWEAEVPVTPQAALDYAWYCWTALGPGKYLFEYENGDDAWERYKARLGDARRLHSGETWSEVLGRVLQRQHSAMEDLEPLQTERETTRFQRDVTRQVLREFEVLGSVGPINPSDTQASVLSVAPPDISYLTADRLLFIVLAHEAISNDPENQVAITRLLGGKKGEMGGIDKRVDELKTSRPDEFEFDDFHWFGTASSRGKAQYLAERSPINAYFSSTEFQGDDGKAKRREHFNNRIKELYAEISEAGVRTVEDVAPYLRKQFG